MRSGGEVGLLSIDREVAVYIRVISWKVINW